MKWFLHLMEELVIDCQVGHPATIPSGRTSQTEHDLRDAELISKAAGRKTFSVDLAAFEGTAGSPGVALTPSSVGTSADQIQERVAGDRAGEMVLRRGSSLWSQSGHKRSQSLPLTTHTAHRRRRVAKRCTPGSKRRSKTGIRSPWSKQANDQRRAADD